MNFIPAVGCVIVVACMGRVVGVCMGGCCGCVGRKRVLASWKASLISLGVCLYMCMNYAGVRMAVLMLFCICGRLVMPYMYGLFTYFLNFCLVSCGSVII